MPSSEDYAKQEKDRAEKAEADRKAAEQNGGAAQWQQQQQQQQQQAAGR